jgi:hypothetical protein
MKQGQIRHVQCPTRHLPFIHTATCKIIDGGLAAFNYFKLFQFCKFFVPVYFWGLSRFQRFFVPVYFWKTVENRVTTDKYFASRSSKNVKAIVDINLNSTSSSSVCESECRAYLHTHTQINEHCSAEMVTIFANEIDPHP